MQFQNENSHQNKFDFCNSIELLLSVLSSSYWLMRSIPNKYILYNKIFAEKTGRYTANMNLFLPYWWLITPQGVFCFLEQNWVYGLSSWILYNITLSVCLDSLPQCLHLLKWSKWAFSDLLGLYTPDNIKYTSKAESNKFLKQFYFPCLNRLDWQ